MAEKNTHSSKLCMAERGSWMELGCLPDCRDPYRNLSRIPLLDSGDGRISVSEGLFQKLEQIPQDVEEIPGGQTGYWLYVAMLFNACMERNALPNVLLDGTEALRRVAADVLGSFGQDGRVDMFGDETVSSEPERGYDIAVLDGRHYRHGGQERFSSVVRCMRRCGNILMVSPGSRTDPFVKKQLRKARHEIYRGVDGWMLPVTGNLQRRVAAGDCEQREDEDRKMLSELWEQLRDLLCETVELDPESQPAEDWEQLLLGVIAGMHALEDMVIQLHRRLDDPELKILCNRVKTAAMDLFLEIRLERPEAAFLQTELNHWAQELKQALEAEGIVIH